MQSALFLLSNSTVMVDVREPSMLANTQCVFWTAPKFPSLVDHYQLELSHKTKWAEHCLRGWFYTIPFWIWLCLGDGLCRNPCSEGKNKDPVLGCHFFSPSHFSYRVFTMTKSLLRPLRLTLGAHVRGLHLVFQLHRHSASLYYNSWKYLGKKDLNCL